MNLINLEVFALQASDEIKGRQRKFRSEPTAMPGAGELATALAGAATGGRIPSLGAGCVSAYFCDLSCGAFPESA